jgi:chemotaxis protein methyltransferase CheR
VNQFEYDYLCQFLKERSGLALAPDKEYLVENRLQPVARKHGRKTVPELIAMLRAPDAGHLKVEVTEAMMNNESYFFRDRVPFDRLGDTVLPELLRTRALRKKIRIWCAAASTGQEPYSIAMLTDRKPELAGWNVEIVATDISGDAIERAKAGLYSQFEVQRGLPIQMLMQHFEEVAGQWRVAERLRNRIDFHTINLLTDFSRLGQFDVVFLRNVLIYFERDTKLDVLARVRQALAPDGYLLLGAAETMVGLGDLFKMVPETRALYRPNIVPKKPDLSLVPGGARVA